MMEIHKEIFHFHISLIIVQSKYKYIFFCKTEDSVILVFGFTD